MEESKSYENFEKEVQASERYEKEWFAIQIPSTRRNEEGQSITPHWAAESGSKWVESLGIKMNSEAAEDGKM